MTSTRTRRCVTNVVENLDYHNLCSYCHAVNLEQHTFYNKFEETLQNINISRPNSIMSMLFPCCFKRLWKSRKFSWRKRNMQFIQSKFWKTEFGCLLILLCGKRLLSGVTPAANFMIVMNLK